LYKQHTVFDFVEVQLLVANLRLKDILGFVGIGTFLLNEIKKLKKPIFLYSDPGAIEFYKKMKFIEITDQNLYKAIEKLMFETVIYDEVTKKTTKPRMFGWDLDHEKMVYVKKRPPVLQIIPPSEFLY
jgi:hypothetical protein